MTKKSNHSNLLGKKIISEKQKKITSKEKTRATKLAQEINIKKKNKKEQRILPRKSKRKKEKERKKEEQ